MGKIKWIASACLIIAGCWISLKLPYYQYAFLSFAIGHILWVGITFKMKEYALMTANIFFLCIDIMGAYNWIYA